MVETLCSGRQYCDIYLRDNTASRFHLWLITVGDGTRTERLRVQQLQRMDAHLLKYPRSLPKGKRKYKNAELIQQAVLNSKVIPAIVCHFHRDVSQEFNPLTGCGASHLVSSTL